jgi:flagellar hook-associated protein 3 FlgL
MRITENMRYQGILRDITRAQRRVLHAQNEVSTGKRVTKPSDDPVAAKDILRINTAKRESDQYLRNLTFAKSKLQFTDGVLDSIEQIVERARTVGQLSFGDPADAEAYATELEGLRDQLVSDANTAYAGRFIFGGSVTTQDPYVKNSDGTVSYNGNSEGMPLQVNRNVSVETQIPGSEVFSGAVNVFDVMTGLITAIRNGDKDGIDAQIGNLEKYAEIVSLARTKVGNYMNLTANVESDLSAAKIAYETELSNKEAADLAQAITELTASQNGLQATLAVGANVSQLTILNFLK